MECTTCNQELNIVEIIQHDCDKILSLDNMTDKQKDLLLYIESQMVDGEGKLDSNKMNHRDFQELKVFHALDIIQAEIIEENPHKDMEELRNTHKVTKFTDRAWELAHQARKEKARNWIERDGRKITENGEIQRVES